jgi:hypothetical protein
VCAEVEPPLEPKGEDRLAACHFAGELPDAAAGA